ncbi:hypothetical protein, partial [Chromobacterium vaccinii]|uniref:hypothetical protein n=1 Tax=Chromobacterium vaccinii TaxID=1108595 RepID=UPI001F386C3B
CWQAVHRGLIICSAELHNKNDLPHCLPSWRAAQWGNKNLTAAPASAARRQRFGLRTDSGDFQ